MSLIDDIRKSALRGAAALGDWARRSNDDVSFDDMKKALQTSGLAEPTTEKPRAMFYDPYAINDWGGWRQRPSSLTYETLRHMAATCTPISAIVQLRVNQIAQFGRPQQGRYDKGYRIVLRDRRDRTRSMSKGEIAKAMEIERMLETTGFLMPSERPRDRDSYRTFLKKSVRDTLIYDQLTFEKQRDRYGRPSRFICLPSETIRPAVVDIEHLTIEQLRERVAYVQIYENSVIAEFTHEELAWCVMNPRSDLRTNGFGYSPIEQIVRLVTAWLFGFQYNQNFFMQGSAVKGVLNVKGTIPDKQMRAFRRQWYAMISGVENAWRTPILNSEDLQWVSMHSTNREMEFSAWMDWLTKLICAVYGVDPIEINFQFGNTGQRQSLNTPDNEEKVTESKDKGLRPLTEFLTDAINQHIVWELAEDFEFAFAGLDSKSEDAEREALTKEVSSYKTINEVRAQEDLPPLPEKQGEAILNPTWVQWALQNAAQPPGGMPGAAPGDAGAHASGVEEAAQGDKEDPPDNLLHQGPHKDPTFDTSDEGDDLLHTDEALAASSELEAFAIERLQKSSRRQLVSGDRQEITIYLPEG